MHKKRAACSSERFRMSTLDSTGQLVHSGLKLPSAHLPPPRHSKASGRLVMDVVSSR